MVTEKIMRSLCKGPNGLDEEFTIPVGNQYVGDELMLGTIRYCNLFKPPYSKDAVDTQIWKQNPKKRQLVTPIACPYLGPAPTQ